MEILKDREQKRDFHPRAQVIIEIERPRITVTRAGEIVRTGGELLVLDDRSLTDASANMSIGRPSDGSFTVANPRDEWFNNARKLSQLTGRQKEVSEYLLQVLNISTESERNWYRRDKFWQLLREGKITRQALEQATRFGTQTEAGVFSRGGGPTSRSEAYSLYEYFSPELDLMNRVWFNFADRNSTPENPTLVAGFSGYISSITCNTAPGSYGTVAIQCRGLLALLQRSEIVLSQAIDQRFEPLSGENIKTTDTQSLTNVLAGLNGIQIIERCVRRTQDVFCYNSGTPEEIKKKNPDDYFHQDKLWQLAGDRYPAPDGEVQANDDGYGPESQALDPSREYQEVVSSAAGPRKMTAEDFNGKLIFDPRLKENDANQFDIFQKAVRQSFKIYQNTNQMAYNLCREVADAVGYDFYDDPKGNITFQIPKYDLLPRLRGRLGIANQDRKGVVTAGPGLLELGDPKYTSDYSDLPYHERDYILDSIGQLSQRQVETEDGLVNYVVATGEPHWIKLADNTMKFLTRTGTTSPKLLLQELGELQPAWIGPFKKVSEEADSIRRLIRRFGVRRHNLRALVTGLSATNYLTRYAYQQMIRMNAGIKSGTIGLNQRPDIAIGRTVFMVEAQKLAYVVGTSNSFNRSSRSNHSTTLTLTFVHPPNERIGIPWLLATDTPAAQEAEVDEAQLYDAKSIDVSLSAQDLEDIGSLDISPPGV
jgi:hypothetical protein